ncbi:MAG TPA: hypothetical protein VE085_04350 [Burkholderiales bacterium]|nr:hypothetical protein [Burkholderiales bacterium]
MSSSGFRVRNERLSDALRRYTEHLADQIQSYLAGGGKQFVLEQLRWKKGEGQSFIQQQETKQFPIYIQSTLRGSLEQSKPYLDALDAFRSDPALLPLVDNLVGSLLGGVRVDAFRLINHLGYEMHKSSAKFEQGVFQSLYQSYESELYSDSVLNERLTPILGLSISEDIEIAPGLSLSRLTDDEVCDLLTHSFVLGRELPTGGFGANTVIEIHHGAIRNQIYSPRRIGDAAFADPSAPKAEVKEFLEEVNEHLLIRALHVYKRGQLHVAGSLTRARGFFQTGVGYRVTPPETPPGPGTYVLTSNDAASLRTLFQDLESLGVARARWLEVAVRRFVYAAERKREEDRLLDYLIAAEAMFLTDTENQGEIRHRLSMRTARFLETALSERREVSRFMRDAYDLRSKVVHGATPEVRSKAIDLGTFNAKLDSLLRRALQEFIRTVASGGSAPDWTDVMLS